MAIPVYNTSIITAVGKAQQGFAFPKFIMGGKGGSGGTTYQLFKQGTSYNFGIWRSEKFKIGQPFKINKIIIPLSAAVAANKTIIPVIQFDDELTSSVANTVNNTTYPNSDKVIYLTSDNFAQALSGDKNFYLELQFTGSALIGVTFPILFEVELIEKL